jgi:hypothetical protein
MVTKDMTCYVELFRSWDIEDSVKGAGGLLDVLLEVGSLFVIGPEALRERVRGGGGRGDGGPNGRGAAGGGRDGSNAGGSGQGKGNALSLDVQEVRAYVLRREDAGSVGMQSVLSSL